MCGISVFVPIGLNNSDDQPVRQMNSKILHRGPDDQGVFHNGKVSLGHLRLSILDLSPAGHQPMQYLGNWITFNGEVYNYIELREELQSKGYQFNSTTDTEVILAAYHCWGEACFSKFNGMWAFCIYDAREDKLVFCRDHFGIKPLYFQRTEQYFAAASEIKQFTVLPGFTPKLNQEVAVRFLVNGMLNDTDATFFEGVHELRAGHSLSFSLSTKKYKITQWYNLAKAIQPVKDDYPTAVQKVRELFTDSVKIRMRSDVAVGSCLSGGIDSSAIVTRVHGAALANDAFATITSCYKDRAYDEQQFSDVVVDQTGFRSVKVYPDLNNLLFGGDLDLMLYHQDQPFSGASHYSEFNVFKTAREQNLIVMLDGQGSDEYFCGYGEFIATYSRKLLLQGKWKQLSRLLKSKANGNLLAGLKSFFRTAFFYPMVGWINRNLRKDSIAWLSPAYRQILKRTDTAVADGSILSLSIQEVVATSLPYQLHSEDRNSMMFSIESRLPFLDHRLMEYAIGLPDDYKISMEGTTKKILREAVSELPQAIRNRKDKMGFVAPDAPWIRQNHEYVRKQLASIVEKSGIFTEQLIERFDRFIKGELGYEPIYFRALAFARFCEIFNINFDNKRLKA